MDISQSGRLLIAGHELPGGKLSPRYLRPYDDGAGIETIGIGHRNDKHKLTELTENEALALFAKDLVWCEEVLDDLAALTSGMRQYQFDALADFLFNVGGRQFRDSPVERAVREHALDSAYVPAAMHLYTRGGGKRLAALIDRRTACEHLWHFGVYKPYNRGDPIR